MKGARMLVIVGVAVCVVLAGLARPAAAGTTYYVDPSGSDDANGLTWATAFATIGKGITSSSGGDVVEVNEGTYNEAINFGGKGITLRSTDPNNPNVVDATVIDANGLGSSAVTCNSSEGPDTILAGFTITGGSATNGGGMYNSGSSPTVTYCNFIYNTATDGGGMYNSGSSPTVADCNFISNTANCGGGMYNSGSSPTVADCNFISNTANAHGGGIYSRGDSSSPTVTNCNFIGNTAEENGGGMLNYDHSSPTVTDCNFTGNTANDHGGGMRNYYSSPTVTNCTFINNSATNGDGGGIATEFTKAGGIPLTLTNCVIIDNIAGDTGGGIANSHGINIFNDCTFSGNSASAGGGMFNYYSSPTLTNCTFSNNTGDNDGGGMWNDNNSDADVTNCTFTGNVATGDDGAGMLNTNSSPTVTNCVFIGNSAYDTGGGMCTADGSDPCLTNCTFSGNSASGGGGGIRNYGSGSNPTATNCIFWGNWPDEISDGGGGVSTVSYSDVQDGWGGAGANNIDLDPLFVEAAGGNLRLRACSPCVDAGNNNSVPADSSDLDGDGNTTEPVPFDVRGEPRFVDDANVPDGGAGEAPIVDMGACERQYNTLIDVDIYNITQDSNYCSIQLAINDACDGDVIEAGLGRYHEPIDFKEKAITLRSIDPNDANIVAATVIDGTGYYHVVQCVSEEDGNTIIAGFTITGGNANGSYPTEKNGGGMFNSGSSPTVLNCIFTGNAAVSGGGMFNSGSSPTVLNCTFIDNTANIDGGGMYNYLSSNPALTSCSFSNNTANCGGGMYNRDYSGPTVTNCNFISNTANAHGGGIYSRGDSSSPTVTNCNFIGNTAEENGGGMLNYDHSSPTIADCTFSGNLANAHGGGMRNYYSSPTVTNCTFINNLATLGDGGGISTEFTKAGGIPLTVTNCLFFDNTAGDTGGGIANSHGVHIFTNCTFRGNSAASNGGGIRNYSSNPTVTNCILWGNSPDEISNSSSSPTVTYSDVEGGTGYSWFGTSNIDSNPFLTPDGHLHSSSPCINLGDPSFVVDPNAPTDMDGEPRIMNGRVEIGADEFADSDGDGLPDWWEQEDFGGPNTADANADPDGDGINNRDEYELYGSNPNAPPINVPAQLGTIQAAIYAASNGDTVLVAEGTYTGANNRNLDFGGKSIILMAPSGAGNTIIDCQNLGRGFNFHSNETPASAVIGFKITNGQASNGGAITFYSSNPQIRECLITGNTATGDGGGIYNSGSSPTVTNCTFSGNYANKGGGMFNYGNDYGGRPTVTNCTFSSNYVIDKGGGMCNSYSTPTVLNCTFSGNLANACGSGMRNYYSSPTVTNCTFIDNTVFEDGGGISTDHTSGSGVPLTLTNCVFSGNYAANEGGGIANAHGAHIFTNCTFIDNTADHHGGGIRNYYTSPIVTNCTFINNLATLGDGGGISTEYTSGSGDPLMVTNCLFFDNTAGDTGGGIANSHGVHIFTNCTFSGNDAYTSGGGIRNWESNPTVTNCILWGDTPDEISNSSSSPTVTYSDVEGGYSGTGNINLNPLFVDAYAGDLRVRDCSPCVDAGNNAAVPADSSDLDGDGNTVEPVPFDVGGEARFVDDANTPDTGSGTPPIVDMGACERQPDTPGFKVRNITSGKNYCSIQAALDDPCTVDGDEIEVAPGTYYEAIDFNDKAVRLYSSGGADVTTIDANGAYHAVQCVSGEGPNTILAGFTITGGNANGGEHPNWHGGGMYCENSSPTLSNCTFTGNTAVYGGGMTNYGGSPTVTNCTFSGNTSSAYPNYGGGGMYNESGSPSVTNCIFSGNSALANGGGMYINNSSPTVTNCTFSSNTADTNGGGMYNSNSSPTLTNCIFWDDSPDEIFNNSSTPTVTYSDIEGGTGQSWFGTGCIDADPCFVNAGGGNLRLGLVSPCIEAGDNNSVPADAADLDGDGNTVEPIPFDVGGSQRIEDGDRDGKAVIDMGALEFNETAYEITVLTYNTHLFGDSSLDEFCGTWPWSIWCDKDDFIYQDRLRLYLIAGKVEESGADIVALQEVWSWYNQRCFVNWFKDKGTYPFGLISDSACSPFLYGDTLGNGLVLLSKFPLSDTGFKRFPTYTYTAKPANDDCWADKGVLTATADTGYQSLRVGISHALTGGVDHKSEWSPDYVGTAITTFDFNGQPYMFALKSDSDQAHITRIDDYSYYDEQDPNKFMYGAGLMHIYDDFWDSDYVAVVSFELNGHPYLFGLKSDSDAVDITRVNDDPSTGWNHCGTYYYPWYPWDKNYHSTTIASFQLNGEAYIFGQKSAYNYARITRMNTDPCTGELDSNDPFVDLGLFPRDSNYSSVVSFDVNGHPYLFGRRSDSNQVCISRINDDPSTGWTDVYEDYWHPGIQYVPAALTSFQLDGHPYIFALATDNEAYISRINDNPSTGCEAVYSNQWDEDLGLNISIKSFQMNGHPYLFALNGCCAQYTGVCGRQRPGEADLCRINNDPYTGWQFVYQMEDMKIIRDQTVGEDDMHAIMMGDFNVHLSKYGIMNNIFKKAGAVDAYMQVHGTGDGGETIDLGKNKLFQNFSSDDPCDPGDYPTESTFDRIDYVYTKPSGAGYELVPTEAHVIRDWKYYNFWDGIPDMDLSDHYPLIVKFQIRRPVDLNADGAVDFVDYAILSEYWLTGEPSVDIAPQPAGDGIIDERDLDILCENWLFGK